jgi:hypothetical protein
MANSQTELDEPSDQTYGAFGNFVSPALNAVSELTEMARKLRQRGLTEQADRITTLRTQVQSIVMNNGGAAWRSRLVLVQEESL